MLKRVLCVFIVVLMLFSVISCNKSETNGNEKESGNDSQAKDNNNNTTDNATTEPVVTEVPTLEFDMEGRKVRIASWWDMKDPERGKTEAGDREADKYEAMYAKYNFSWEYVKNDFSTEMLVSSVMAGDPYTDIMYVDCRWLFPGVLSKSLLTPWNDLDTIDPTDAKWDRMKTENATYKGKIYGSSPLPSEVRSVVFWNKKIFDDNNVESLYPLIKNKQWTWDKLVELGQKMTKDTNNDSINDIWGMSGQQGTADSDFEMGILASNNVDAVRFDENGKPTFTLDEPNGLEALQFLQDLRQRYKICYMAPSGSDWKQFETVFADGKVGILFAGYYFVGDFKEIEMEYGVAYVPMGPQANDYNCVLTVFNIEGFPSGIKDPDKVAYLYNLKTDPAPGSSPDDWRQQVENDVQDEDAVEIVRSIMYDNITRPNYMCQFAPILSASYGLLGNIANGSGTPKELLDNIVPQVQQQLDDLFKDE